MTESKSFYEPLFTVREKCDLTASPLKPAALLDDEINMVRVSIRRMLKLSKHQQPEETIRTLAILSAVTGRLANLLRTQQQLKAGGDAGEDSDLRAMLDRVLDEVNDDWKIV